VSISPFRRQKYNFLKTPGIFLPASGKKLLLSYICCMRRFYRLKALMAFPITGLLLLNSCVSYRYIHNGESLSLQKKIQGRRTANIAGGSLLTVGSVVLAWFTGVYVGYTPGANALKTLRLVNTSKDTLQVNLLSDVFWKDSVYCDIKDIRIPPGERCRVLVPAAAQYNLYFSNTVDSEDDDEMIPVNPLSGRKVVLFPGMTLSETDSIPSANQLK
jgi:hypothetical protein